MPGSGGSTDLLGNVLVVPNFKLFLLGFVDISVHGVAEEEEV